MTDAEKFVVGPEAEIPEGGRKVVRCGEREIGIFRVKGELHAWHNRCPHRQGPVCQGRIFPRVVEPVDGEQNTRMLQYDETAMHLARPWHGYEFNVETGRDITGRYGLRRVNLTIESETVYVLL